MSSPIKTMKIQFPSSVKKPTTSSSVTCANPNKREEKHFCIKLLSIVDTQKIHTDPQPVA